MSRTRISTTPARRTRSLAARGGAAAAIAGALVLAAPLAAQAHVGVNPDAVSAGSSSVLTFAFSHGCDGSPTTALEFEIPEGVTNVAPTVQAGWDIEVTRAANESVSSVVFTADEPIDDGLRATVTMSARFAAELADSSVAFPVTQVCETGETAWVEIPEEGQGHDDLDAPAPMVAVGAVAEDDHGHGGGSDHDHSDGEAAAGDDHGADGHDDASASEAASSTQPADSVLPVVLGASGLVAGLAALVVAVLAYRRRA